MKKQMLVLAGLVAMQQQAFAQTTGSPAHHQGPVLASSEEFEKNFIRSENEINQATLAQMPFDAFLAESGYVVYPIEENCAVLQAKVSKNPMVLHKEFIQRRVRVLRRVDGRSSDGAVKGVLGKQFMIVSEIGSVSQFMVDVKDLHFIQDKDQALDHPK
jgi:hypothetical protein